MDKSENMPIWVFLAFSSINTRKSALLLIGACVLFTLYCVPWPLLFTGNEWIAKIFLIDDWSWLAMMVPVLAWYFLSLRWVDKHSGWEVAGEDAGSDEG